MVEVLSAERHETEEGSLWVCWLEIVDGKDTWYLPANAPGDLAAGDLAAHFGAQADALCQTAQEKGYTDMWVVLPVRALLKALASSQGLGDSQVKEALSADVTP
jgi:hypothetical protein